MHNKGDWRNLKPSRDFTAVELLPAAVTFFFPALYAGKLKESVMWVWRRENERNFVEHQVPSCL